MAEPERHIPFLDTMRGIAIALVFAFHSLGASFNQDHLAWTGWFRDLHAPLSFLALWPASLGWSGVAVFFVISGFCIHLSHERSRKKGFKVFFIRRFFRIYPTYFLTLVLFTLWTSLVSGFQQNFPQFLTHALLIHNFDPKFYFGINPSYWSIAVEAQLYLLYPVLIYLTRRWGWRGVLWTTGLMEIGLRILSGCLQVAGGEAHLQWLFGSPLFYWFSWSIGAMIAEDYMKKRPIFMSRSPLWIWPPLILASYGFLPAFDLCYMFIALLTACVMAKLLTRTPVRPYAVPMMSPHLRLAGKLSYSFYLIHQPLVEIVPKGLSRLLGGAERTHPLVGYASCMVAWFPILAASWCLYRLAEVPSIELGKRFVARIGAGAGGTLFQGAGSGGKGTGNPPGGMPGAG